MKKFILLFIFFYFFSNFTLASNPKPNFKEESVYTNNIKQKEPVVSYIVPFIFPLSISTTKKFPTFWVVFIISAIGAFTLYGLAAGLIALTIVYFATKGNKKETKKAFWGFLVGLVVGLGIKLLTFLLL